MADAIYGICGSSLPMAFDCRNVIRHGCRHAIGNRQVERSIGLIAICITDNVTQWHGQTGRPHTGDTGKGIFTRDFDRQCARSRNYIVRSMRAIEGVGCATDRYRNQRERLICA